MFQEKGLLMSYKGNSYLDSGYFYAPYVPITSSPVVLDPNVFSPRKGIMTRYGKKILAEGAVYQPNKKNKTEYRSIDDDWQNDLT